MGSYTSSKDRSGSTSGGSSSSTDTHDSDRSKSTAPTAISDRTIITAKYQNWNGFEEETEKDESESESESGPRDSVSTYASTTHSTTDAEEPLYEVGDRQEIFPTDALSSTPTSFASLFPSSRRLLIRHDDATLDGNMNLRVDTSVPCRGGYQQEVILFHLRMYDLFSRKFSLRRYCRDSGREVCHTARKAASTSQDKRPILRRSWSSVLASLRPGPHSHSHNHAHGDSLKRQSSNWEGGHCREHGNATDIKSPVLEDTILMEFANYAHVELRRRGPWNAKRYEYEYWSTKYQWRREFRKEGDLREVSYHLVDTRTSKTIAHMVPWILAPLEVIEEESKGGWVPPCSLWISDPLVYERMSDIAE
ncbi:hypothetical protein N7495_007077 [Penicillium taxi]|uniref:uncharacterized protein n=1 Tax=Penicillium taxi TaxID=168475 RepID=UPI0025451A10|nr:uncharacterized protein N7495_007077 [Penicillium taxi]KAJ5895386.1 hypothetical protein N7495_007077 [Penicillium taxi]